MNCAQCGTPGTAVTKTFDKGKRVERRRICPCGWQQTTKESWDSGTGSFMGINDRGEKALVVSGAKGGISLPSEIGSFPLEDPERARGVGDAKKSPYSDEFEACWQKYGRKEEKVKAYTRWKVEAKVAGGELALRDLVLAALVWQGPAWARDGWRFAKYFERYLKARKWEDEPMPTFTGDRRPASRGGATVQNISNWLSKDVDK